ncbi:MAG: SNF2-related protein, partial [archaeon]|nr:SNF2-related protein [archaeon]
MKDFNEKQIKEEPLLNNMSQTNEEGINICNPKDENISCLTQAVNYLSKEIQFLNQKRKFPGGTIKDKKELKKLKQITPIISEYSQSLPFTQNDKNMKVIGITSEDIYAIKRFKVDLLQLPKFSTFSNMEEFFASAYNSSARQNDTNKLITKKKILNFSAIEKMNKENLRMIEQRRQKYKNLPKANKERMDDERLKKYWIELAKHEIPKMQKIMQRFKSKVEVSSKRFAFLIQKEVRKKMTDEEGKSKIHIFSEKRLLKEMIKKEREMVDLQKKKNKIEIDRRKKEEELNEQIIQKKRMEYLLKQSDIYSLMMYKHLGAFMPQNDNNENEQNENNLNEVEMKNKEENKQNNLENKEENKMEIEKEEENNINNNSSNQENNTVRKEVIGGKEVLVNTKTNKIIFNSIKVDIDEQKAQSDVNELINFQRQKANEFDVQLNKIRKTLGGKEVQLTNYEALKEIEQQKETKENDNQLERLDRPMINNTSSQLIERPNCFVGELKEYQLKGLRWLDNLYSQGINGILADEMGLGKTIQAIAFLAHLAEERNNWGPFLVIAPNATLYNWQQEFNRFCPTLRVLPYWGALKERKTLRKFFNSTQLYIKSSSFHVCITSYQLAVADKKVFHKVNWNYMILDEAQAIKNIASQRWNVLLSFNCRNRLLLSGTPIQNSMSELWALLHFIMPNLFDSHEQFQEWFSKDIEAHSQNKGELNQEQLKRLHKILKPFMLRRVKKDVETEIGPKVEYEIFCDMTEKQRILYSSIKDKLNNISDLFVSTDSKVKVTNLLNLVMQFRKVCNHPELFERNFGKIPFVFEDLAMNQGRNNMMLLNNNVSMIISNSKSLISYHVPKMIYDFCYNKFDILRKLPKIFHIFRNENILDSVEKDAKSLFNFAFLLGFPLSSFISLCKEDSIINFLSMFHFFSHLSIVNKYSKNQKLFEEEGFKENYFSLFLNGNLIQNNFERSFETKEEIIPPLIISNPLLRKEQISTLLVNKKIYVPKALAFTPEIICSNSQLEIQQKNILNDLFFSKIFYGVDYKQIKTSLNYKLPNKRTEILRNILPEIDSNGILTALFSNGQGYTQIELPTCDKLISDCAKLKKLDELLNRLFAEGHRVLIFAQMTKLLDILEDYMSKKKFTYFRMDGSTQIADRRDMINEFQTNPKIFAFLLSTRAGGLGVNLTGADTVIFYDLDWNPQVDLQAMDRAHRIGQKKLVSVYRLVTKGTIEERILKRAQQKKNIQTTVYSGGAFKADIFKQKDIVELLYSEEEMQKMEVGKKKILLELNEGIIEKKEGDLAKMEEEFNNELNNGENQMNYGGSKMKKKRGKKSKEKRQINSTNKKSAQKGNNLFGVSTESGTNDKNGNNASTVRNIFNVHPGNVQPKKPKFNAKVIKVDSDDEENNIIIDDGVHSLNMDMMDNEERNIVKQYYKLYDINKLGKKDDKEQLLADYPILETEPIYVLRNT